MARGRMDALAALLDPQDPAWPLVQEWLEDGEGRVRALPRDARESAATLLHLQATTRSVLGALAWETAGLVVDGRVRVLGGGSAEAAASLRTWNGGGADGFAVDRGLVRVGFDVFGGVFALNGGALGPADGAVHYFSPDTLAWEPLGLGHAAWVRWLLTEEDRVAGFYEAFAWPGWEAAVAPLGFDEAFAMDPPPWTAEAEPPARVAPVREVVTRLMEASRRRHGAA